MPKPDQVICLAAAYLGLFILGLEPHSEGAWGGKLQLCLRRFHTEVGGDPQYHMGQHQENLSPGTFSLYFPT